MSGARSRRKGASYEREVVHRFREAMPGADVKRGFQTRSGQEAADVECPVFWVESKRGKKPNMRGALAQAIKAAPDGRVPIAVVRDDRDGLELCDDFTDLPFPEGRLVAGFDVGRSHDRSELALFEEVGGRFVCRLLRSYDRVPFAEQEADLSRMLNTLPIARLSIDKSGIGMNLAENLGRAFPQVVGEAFTSASKERWCTDSKILLQRRDVDLPRDRELVAQLHSIKRRVMPSGNVTFEAERTNRGHADRFWAIVLACQKERGPAHGAEAEVAVRVIG